LIARGRINLEILASDEAQNFDCANDSPLMLITYASSERPTGDPPFGFMVRRLRSRLSDWKRFVDFAVRTIRKDLGQIRDLGQIMDVWEREKSSGR
jgi:hypothetical protein